MTKEEFIEGWRQELTLLEKSLKHCLEDEDYEKAFKRQIKIELVRNFIKDAEKNLK